MYKLVLTDSNRELLEEIANSADVYADLYCTFYMRIEEILATGEMTTEGIDIDIYKEINNLRKTQSIEQELQSEVDYIEKEYQVKLKILK